MPMFIKAAARAVARHGKSEIQEKNWDKKDEGAQAAPGPKEEKQMDAEQIREEVKAVKNEILNLVKDQNKEFLAEVKKASRAQAAGDTSYVSMFAPARTRDWDEIGRNVVDIATGLGTTAGVLLVAYAAYKGIQSFFTPGVGPHVEVTSA